MEFEWNIFPGFDTLQLSEEVKILPLRLGETPGKFHRKNSILCRCPTTFPVETKDNEKRICGKC